MKRTSIIGLTLVMLGGAAHAEEPPLLGSSHAKSPLVEPCDGENPKTLLLPDPRRLVRPGVNEGRNVMFNVWWDDCHVNTPMKQPATCGELRERAERGREILLHRHMPRDLFKISAEQYENLWRVWGFPSKPEHYEAEVRERYGLGVAPGRNPYPVGGEDPNATDGGSGQLPLGLVQVRRPNGTYTGEVTINCVTCHGGSIGDPETDGGPGTVIGLGSTNLDAQLLISEMALGIPLPIPLSSTRGTTNAEGLSELLFQFRDLHSMDSTLRPLRSDVVHSNGGDTAMPPWWNLSHRPRKFHEAGLSSDNGRMTMLLWYAADGSTYPGDRIRGTTDDETEAVQAYLDTLTAPPFPGEVDQELAKEGAVLFHTLNLWGPGRENPTPRPEGGNGSCAGCHGVYSPHFAADPAFLEDPQLQGLSAYIPRYVGTDPARLEGMPMSLRQTLGVSWIAYPEGQPGYVPPEEKDPLTEFIDDYQFATSDRGIDAPVPGQPFGACAWEREEIGYQAPQLHGIWASAPYLHNDSVPDVWGVLDPDERPDVWLRPSSQGPTINHGFDTSLAAYDMNRLGWKYTELQCSEEAGIPYLSCDPGIEPLGVVADAALGLTGRTVTAGYVATPGVGLLAEYRKIFNTHMFAKGNEGHDWTAALTDEERLALVEYLKTL